MDDFSQFVQQPFVGPVVAMMCFFGFLLAAVIVLLLVVRRRKAQAAAAAGQPAVLAVSELNPDMPDLDLLVVAPPVSAPPAPAAPRPTRKGATVVAVADGDAAEAVEVLSVLRDLVDGSLIVQMGDRAYRNLNADADFKERFNKVMREVAALAKAPSAPARVETAPETDQPAAPPAASQTPPAALQDLLPDRQPPAPAPAFTPPAPTPPTAPLPGDLPRFSLDDQGPIKPPRGQKREVKPVPEINLAAAIEAFLQHKLRQTPQFASRSIHIHPSPNGGVSIEVDDRFYDAVSEVADAEVRAFLQSAIEEWQDRH